MNKQGGIMFGVVIALFSLMTGILFVSFMETEVDNAQAGSYTYGANIIRPGLQCGAANDSYLNITDGAKLTCLVTEAVNPYFIVILLSVALGFITNEFVSGRER